MTQHYNIFVGAQEKHLSGPLFYLAADPERGTLLSRREGEDSRSLELLAKDLARVMQEANDSAVTLSFAPPAYEGKYIHVRKQAVIPVALGNGYSGNQDKFVHFLRAYTGPRAKIRKRRG